MILGRNTRVWVIRLATNGMSPMTFGQLIDSFKGGTNIDDIIITTSHDEASEIYKKQLAVKHLLETVSKMTTEEIDLFRCRGLTET